MYQPAANVHRKSRPRADSLHHKTVFPSTKHRAGIVFIKVNASIGLSFRKTVGEPETSLVIQGFSPGVECMIRRIQGVESVNGDDTTTFD